MYLQKQILEWLQSLSINVIKHVLTIKNPANSIYIKRILGEHPEFKPVDRISHGYSEVNINKNQKYIYQRDKYRYKKKKEEKVVMDKILFENITVSRLTPCSFSLKKSFIKSKHFSECMMLFSDYNLFNFTDLKQTPVKLGAEKQMKSIWFEPTHLSSLSEWFVHLFEAQIFEAYLAQRQTKTHLNTQLNHFTYVTQHITPQFINNELRNILQVLSEKRFNGRYAKKSGKKEIFFTKDEEEEEFEEILQVPVHQVPYLLKRCLEKLQSTEDGVDEAIFQLHWLSEDRTVKANRVLKDLCRIVARRFKEFQLDTKAKQIEALASAQSGKKKKRKGKKNCDENQQQKPQKPSESKEDLEKVEQNKADTQQLDSKEVKESHTAKQELKTQACNKKVQQKPLMPAVLIKKQEKTTNQVIGNSVQESPVKEDKKKKAKNTKPPKVQQMPKVEQVPAQLTKPRNMVQNAQKQSQKLHKKVVKERINEQVLFYYKQLSQHSHSMDKYRRICLQLIESSIAEMQLKIKWQLMLFGSYSIDFALRQSDLDLVVIVQKNEEFSLDKLLFHLKVKEWLRECNIKQIQSTKVDVLQFQILLSCVKHPKIKDAKRLPKDIIHVDITMAESSSKHQGIRNTMIIKEIFQQNPNLKVVSLIFKELLRIYDLNKPFKGGIASFALVILIYNVLTMERADKNDDFIHQMNTICCFMSEKFQPYKTLITANKKTVLTADPKQILNIEDPQENTLIYTAKIRQMNQIISLLRSFQGLLKSIEVELLQVGTEERKKMKRIFFEKWESFFRPCESWQLEN